MHLRFPFFFQTKVLYAFFLTVCFILVNGYHFNTGDQAEHLPQVYRMLDPSLYPNDFFLTLYDQTFTVRTYWVWLVYTVSLVTGVSAACFLLYFISIQLSILAWIYIGDHFTKNKYASGLTPILIFFIVNSITVGGNTLAGVSFVGSIPAEALAGWGIYCYLKDRKSGAAVLLGLATLFQLLVGLQLFLIFMMNEIWNGIQHKSFKAELRFAIIFLTCALPVLIPVFGRQFFTLVSTNDLQLFYQTLYFQRAPWHYIPTLFPLRDYFTFLAILTAGWFTSKTIPSHIRLILLRMAGIIIAGCLLFSVFIIWLNLPAIGKLQWFKTTVWLNAICCIMISGWIGNRLPQQWFKPAFISFSRTGFFIAGLAGIMLITLSGYFSFSVNLPKYQIGNYRTSSLTRMHEWIRDNTPVNALFLIPPDNESFTCEARRPVPVNYKALVHEPFYFIEWRKTMNRYYDVDWSQLNGETALGMAKRKYCSSATTSARFPEINYVLLDESVCQISDSVIVHREDSWVLLSNKP